MWLVRRDIVARTLDQQIENPAIMQGKGSALANVDQLTRLYNSFGRMALLDCTSHAAILYRDVTKVNMSRHDASTEVKYRRPNLSRCGSVSVCF